MPIKPTAAPPSRSRNFCWSGRYIQPDAIHDSYYLSLRPDQSATLGPTSRAAGLGTISNGTGDLSRIWNVAFFLSLPNLVQAPRNGSLLLARVLCLYDTRGRSI